ncbi:VOC family protein [Sphingomonas sp. LB2R24]|uniref:VOC family protein n=1 Tax=Sphingomonas sorbitolis TaxID=3096165 RepID=UPI002FC60EC2
MDQTTNKLDVHAGIVALDHVAIAVNDLEASVRTYTNALGFVEVERRTTNGKFTGMVSAVLRSGEATVVLVQGLQPESQVSRFVSQYGEGVQHIAFRVEDIDRAIANADRSGLATETGVLAESGIRQTFLKREANTGTRIELIELRGGRFSDASVQKLFNVLEEQDVY